MIHAVATTESLLRYVSDVSVREDDLAAELRRITLDLPLHTMLVPAEEGQLLGLLVALLQAREVIEVGVFTGYSTLCMARALAPGGRVVACDISPEWTDIARSFWQRAGVADLIDLRLAPAVDTLCELLGEGRAGTVDLIFVDADKESYHEYVELGSRLLRPGGLMVLDNVLWSGLVVDPDVHDPETDSLRALNARLRDDDRFALSMLPVFDGVTLLWKR
jgi:O-methyltransferase